MCTTFLLAFYMVYCYVGVSTKLLLFEILYFITLYLFHKFMYNEEDKLSTAFHLIYLINYFNFMIRKYKSNFAPIIIIQIKVPTFIVYLYIHTYKQL